MTLSAQSIKEHLDKFVIGQDKAKQILSNTLFMHIARINYLIENDKFNADEALVKVSSLMVMGPSGSGKTFMIEKAADYLELPVYKINAKSLSNSGYVGMSIEDHFALYHKEFSKYKFFKYGIIFIDEFDKLCLGDEKGWYRQLQYSLLKYVEGMTVKTESKGFKADVTVDTSNLLFIFAGNFEHLRQLRERNKSSSMGFVDTTSKDKLDNFQKELVEAGVVREIMGRIAKVVEISALSEDDYLNILENSQDSSYTNYKTILRFLGVKRAGLSKKHLKEIAKRCVSLDIGARGLTSLLDEAYSDKIAKLSLKTTPSQLIELKENEKLKGSQDTQPMLTFIKIGDDKDE